jgi:uncharacterized protein (TIGR02231 family)
MKRTLLLSFCCLLIGVVKSQNLAIFNASLESVTVYRTGASLNHSVKVNLPMGTSEVILGNIANSIDPNSIQISTPVDVTILSTTFNRDYLKNITRSAAYLKVEDSLNIAKRELNVIQNKKTVEENMLIFLDKNQVVGGANAGTNLAELIKLSEYYRNKQLEIRNAIFVIVAQEVKQQLKVSKLQQQLNELGADQSGVKGQLVLQINAKEANAGAVLQFSYLSQNASWVPSYDLRGESIATPLKIAYKANVLQNTGIDWKKVKLSLSTAAPTQSGTAPLLSAWFLRFGDPGAYLRNMAYQNSLQRMESRTARVPVASAAPAKDQNLATPTENVLNTTFDIAIPYDIASDNKIHSVVMNTYNQPVNYKYYAVPKLESDVYLMAELSGHDKLNLLVGEANVIFENTYVGKTIISPSATTDTLNLSMGKDKKIVVKREKVVDENAVRSIGGSKKQTFTYEITVRNGKNTPINLLLKDQYPISTDKAIEVELLNSAGAIVNAETGVLTWKLTLAAGAMQKVRISYSVKYPKDQSIENL